MAGASKTILIDAPMDLLFEVITDYESYPSFLSDVSEARVVERTSDGAIVEFSLNLIKKVSYTLNIVEDKPTGLHWTLDKSSLMKSNVGGWNLESLTATQTRATYKVEVTPRGFVPGSIVNALTGRTLPTTLEAFKLRAEARANKG